ncbi:MAG: polymer-forming cytoskeletal protein [Candidatus Thiodiazotropha sp.]
MALSVPIPELKVEGITGYSFLAEKPIGLQCEAVTFPDGSVLEPAQAQQFGYRLFRRTGSTLEVWDSKQKEWMPQGSEPEPEPLAYQEGLWQNLLVAMGQQDSSGQDQFATDRLSGAPSYHVRCLFTATDAAGITHEGISPPSADFTVYAAGELDRAGLAMEPPEKTEAEEIRLYLKDAALTAEQGVIAIRQQGSGFEIDLAVGGARLTLGSSGDIVLSPAAGGRVELAGDLLIDGDLQVQQQLTVAGAAQLQGGVSIGGALDVTGNVSILGTLRVNGVVMSVP